MASYTYTATVHLPKVGDQKVSVQADNESKARAMLEAQYGKGNVRNVHRA
jgi:hypothetical protein